MVALQRSGSVWVLVLDSVFEVDLYVWFRPVSLQALSNLVFVIFKVWFRFGSTTRIGFGSGSKFGFSRLICPRGSVRSH